LDDTPDDIQALQQLLNVAKGNLRLSIIAAKASKDALSKCMKRNCGAPGDAVTSIENALNSNEELTK
jgi:hypothetical protein